MDERIEGFEESYHEGLSEDPFGCIRLLTGLVREIGEPPYDAETLLSGPGDAVREPAKDTEDKCVGRARPVPVAANGEPPTPEKLARMRSSLDFLDDLVDHGRVTPDELWLQLAGRVRAYLAAHPFPLVVHGCDSMCTLISGLVEAALKRTNETGTVGLQDRVMRHLVEATVRLMMSKSVRPGELPGLPVRPGDRSADVLIGDTAIHVAYAVGETIMARCLVNLKNNARPLVITSEDGMSAALAFASSLGCERSIEVLEIGQFVAGRIHQWGTFADGDRLLTIHQLVEEYNTIVDEVEHDPSLRISIGQ